MQEGKEMGVCCHVIQSSACRRAKEPRKKINFIPMAVKMEVNITNKPASRLHYLDSELFKMCNQGK